MFAHFNLVTITCVWSCSYAYHDSCNSRVVSCLQTVYCSAKSEYRSQWRQLTRRRCCSWVRVAQARHRCEVSFLQIIFQETRGDWVLQVRFGDTCLRLCMFCMCVCTCVCWWWVFFVDVCAFCAQPSTRSHVHISPLPDVLLLCSVDVEHSHVRFLGDLVLNLWDCGGQEAFMENYFTSQRHNIFRNVAVLIYVFDVESKSTFSTLSFSTQVYTNITETSGSWYDPGFSFHFESMQCSFWIRHPLLQCILLLLCMRV